MLGDTRRLDNGSYSGDAEFVGSLLGVLATDRSFEKRPFFIRSFKLEPYLNPQSR